MGAAMAAYGLVNFPDQRFVKDHSLAEFQVRNGVTTQVGNEVSDND